MLGKPDDKKILVLEKQLTRAEQIKWQTVMKMFTAKNQEARKNNGLVPWTQRTTLFHRRTLNHSACGSPKWDVRFRALRETLQLRPDAKDSWRGGAKRFVLRAPVVSVRNISARVLVEYASLFSFLVQRGSQRGRRRGRP